MTWQSDEDFLEDISQLDDFRESIDPEVHSRQFIQNAEVRDKRHEKQKKSFLEIDDDEDVPVSYGTEAKSILGISDDVGRQIENVVGKKYNNDYLETKWKKQETKTDKNAPRGHSFVFEPNAHFKPLDPSDDFKPFVEHAPKKCSIASMIEKNVNKLKSEPSPPTKSPVKKSSEIKKPEVPVRFALPIMNGMKHYNGDDVKITNYEEEYGRSNGKWSSDWSDWSDCSVESNFDQSSFNGSMFSNNNCINVNSKTDFPPL